MVELLFEEHISWTLAILSEQKQDTNYPFIDVSPFGFSVYYFVSHLWTKNNNSGSITGFTHNLIHFNTY